FVCLLLFMALPVSGTKQGADRYVLIPQQTKWMAAQNFCREHHTDLTSLRNHAEYQTVEGVSKGQDVYVGLSRDPWEWSDQTESSLRFWRPTQTVNTAYAEKCVALLSGESGHWRDMDCTVERPFLCSYSELCP
uniref:C-type lectin domain-containing protein n=1 Tax=Oryzias latipes TaxID=8090 RepID=A0A3B3HSS7_ORYLA